VTDRLFLLHPDWTDDLGGPWFCPAGALIEGVLAFYPALKTQIEVIHLPFERPRQPVIDLVGPDHQGCPILVLDGEHPWPDALVSEATGRLFLQDEAMLPYLAARYGIGQPHP
jgi:hypothetical protein